jgi:hypothetical protein
MAVSRVIFKRPKVVYKHIREMGVVGLAYNDRQDDKYGTVEVDPRQSDAEFIKTTVHELLHWHFPDLTERQVVKMEKAFGKKVWNAVSRLRRKWNKASLPR